MRVCASRPCASTSYPGGRVCSIMQISTTAKQTPRTPKQTKTPGAMASTMTAQSTFLGTSVAAKAPKCVLGHAPTVAGWQGCARG